MRKILLIFSLIFSFVFLTIISSATIISASNTIQYFNDSEIGGGYYSWTKLKEITVTDSYTGSWRITFDLDRVANGVSKGQVYKNGVIYGSEFSTPGDAGFYHTESQDFTSININNGDKIQLYGLAVTDGAVYVRNFRIEFDSMPSIPVLTTHANYHTSSGTTVSWSASTGTSPTYYYNVGTTSGGIDVINNASTTTLSSSSFTMTPTSTYYWKVKACNTVGCSDYSTESSFAFTNTVPTTPSNIAHSNYHTSAATTVSWNAATDADGDLITYYYNVGTSSGGVDVINNVSTTSTASSSFTMTPTNNYYWKVKACDAYACSAYSTESSFVFTNTVPTTPSISFPSNNSRQYVNGINYTWNTSTDAEGDPITYDFWLSNQSNFGYTVNRTNFSNNWTGNIATTDGVTYYGEVRSYDGYGYSSWSSVVQFTENTAPVVVNITLSPANPSGSDNLTISMNGTDAEGDTLTPHYHWYKNGVLNTSWNDITQLNNTNYTAGDQLYVRGFYNDGYENSTELQSNTVKIGSSNSAPKLSGITLNPSTKKYNKNITVSTANNITDSESTLVRMQVYRYISGVKSYFGNSSWFAPPNNVSVEITIPWSDGLTHTIYAQAQDNGNVTQDPTTNLTSSEVTVTFTSDITSPTVNSSTVSPSSVTIGSNVTITITADGKGANISSANVTIARPDYTTVTLNLTCTYTSGDISTCTRSYTANSGTGTYSISNFGLADDSGNSVIRTSILTFVTTESQGGGSGSGGGGGGSGGAVITVTTPVTEIVNKTVEVLKNLTPPLAPALLQFRNITSGSVFPQSEILKKCLTESIVMDNACSGGNFFIIESQNWWVLSAGYLFAFIFLISVMISRQKPRNLVTDTAVYGTLVVVISALLIQGAGLNIFVLNYLLNDARYAWSFLTIGIYGFFISAIGDYFSHRKKNKNGEWTIL